MRLLDLYCCQGGAAMGYHMAGFEVVGVDMCRQPKYPFEMVQADCLEILNILLSGGSFRTPGLFGNEYHLSDFDAIHASPPCQGYSALKHMARLDDPRHRMLINETRELLEQTGLPYVIENVEGARAVMGNPVTLCGTMFDLNSGVPHYAILIRHRCFEANWPLVCGLHCQCSDNRKHNRQAITITGTGNALGGVISIAGGHARDKAYEHKKVKVISVYGDHPRDETVRWNARKIITITGHQAQDCPKYSKGRIRECFSVKEAQTAMGINWMGMAGLSQAIPPAYTQYIGSQMLIYAV